MTRTEAARRAGRALYRNHQAHEAIERELVMAVPDEAWFERVGHHFLAMEAAGHELEHLADELLAGDLSDPKEV